MQMPPARKRKIGHHFLSLRERWIAQPRATSAPARKTT
jgi:hypothetical protein